MMLEITPLNDLSTYLQKLTKGKLWLQVIFALLLGVVTGILLHPSTGLINEEVSLRLSNWLSLPGELFLKLVQMIMIPLIVTSIISGIVSNDTENLKSMGSRLLLYFIMTTTVAITIGIIISQLTSPGRYIFELGGFPGADGNSSAVDQSSAPLFTSIPDAISNLIPSNPLQAMLTGEMLGVVIFTVIIGVAITQLKKETAHPIIRFSESIQKICMIVVSWAMKLVPYAVFGLIASLLASIGMDVLFGLGYFILVVIAGLLVLMVFYLLLLFVTTGTSPFTFLQNAREAQLLAFSTASSAAVMPLSMKIADEKLKVSSHISDFVIPVGASINMDGTALFQCVSALFMAQAYGMELSIMNLLFITITIVAASIGTPAVPGGGVIILASVLGNAGIPTDGLIVIIGIDRILGMFRTAVNVTGDLVACVLFNKWYGTTRN